MAPNTMLQKKGPISTRKARAAEYYKRRSRKAEAASTGDVYEYFSGKNKRSAVILSLDKDETMGLGPENVDDGIQADRDALRTHIMSMGDADGVVNSEDDEEIESDDAFEESDEERFAGFSFSNKKGNVPRSARSKVHFGGVDLDENQPDRQSVKDSDEEEEGKNDEYLDVLDVLDGRGEADIGDKDQQSQEEDNGEEDDREESEEPLDDAMEDAFAPSDNEDQSDEEALHNLGAFVSQLEPDKKRKAENEAGDVLVDGDAAPTRKRRMLKESTQAGVEGEFSVHAASGSKLQLDQLLDSLPPSSSLQALKRSSNLLTKRDALPAPLPQRTQDRIDREAAYEQTKGEVDKWKATMKRIKEADHLSFPLQAPQKIKPSNSELTARFKPTTELESAVDKLLRAAQMRDESDITKTEALKMNHLSVEEVAERRGELRKMRELMFRAEAKAKRVAKIKSKTYRKIQRKGREKVRGLIEEAEGPGSLKDEEAERMKREVERAKERATLRHKNTGKWAKAMKGRGELEEDQRQDIEEMLDKGERLRAKIRGDGGSEDDDDDEQEGGVEGIKTNAFKELRRLERDEAEDAATLPGKAKGVFAMRFMQEAMAREARRAGEVVDDFRNEIARLGGGGSDEDAADAGAEDAVSGPSGMQVQRLGGRLTFRPGQAMVASWPIAPSDSSSTLKSSEPALQSPAVASQQTFPSPLPIPPDDFIRPSLSPAPEPRAAVAKPNPWLQPRSATALQPQSRRKIEVLIGEDSAGADKSKKAMKRRLLKGAEERERAKEDAVVEINLEGVLGVPGEGGSGEAVGTGMDVGSVGARGREKAKLNRDGRQVDAAYEDSDADSEVEAQEQQVNGKATGKSGKNVKAFEQRDLVARAFAGDNVVQDFAKLKKREIEADAPRNEDRTLPGWGLWGGAGVRHNPKAKKSIKKVAGIDPTSRADHGKPHLIISEKREKKAAKYLTKDLPYPYTSRAQFERSMEVPIGTDWNTRVGFQRGTLPRVVKKMGAVIDPLEKF
ncbi:small-subunit processome [Ramaria rubella]|nr:small-subunit processome [Ramaria rubella]